MTFVTFRVGEYTEGSFETHQNEKNSLTISLKLCYFKALKIKHVSCLGQIA